MRYAMVFALMFAGAGVAEAACMADGRWVGTWGGVVPTSVTVKGCKITSYTYNNTPQRVGSQQLNGDTIVMTVRSGSFYFFSNGTAQYGGLNGTGVGSFQRQ